MDVPSHSNVLEIARIANRNCVEKRVIRARIDFAESVMRETLEKLPIRFGYRASSPFESCAGIGSFKRERAASVRIRYICPHVSGRISSNWSLGRTSLSSKQSCFASDQGHAASHDTFSA